MNQLRVVWGEEDVRHPSAWTSAETSPTSQSCLQVFTSYLLLWLFQVIDQEEGKFAFIHDAAQIRYEVSRNCNLTEVGEMFAEQPYAIAVQQGSHLQEEISRK